jgi:hypothetical protein
MAVLFDDRPTVSCSTLDPAPWGEFVEPAGEPLDDVLGRRCGAERAKPISCLTMVLSMRPIDSGTPNVLMACLRSPSTERGVDIPTAESGASTGRGFSAGRRRSLHTV